jgi:hypothetical protein
MPKWLQFTGISETFNRGQQNSSILTDFVYNKRGCQAHPSQAHLKKYARY